MAWPSVLKPEASCLSLFRIVAVIFIVIYIARLVKQQYSLGFISVFA